MMNSAAEGKAVVDVQGDGRWSSMHKRFIRESIPGHDIVFIGDSIIMNFKDTETWDKYFKPLKALNLGIGGDCTQHVLWRVVNGELGRVNPKVVVIHVGTNNHENTAEEIVEGIESICWAVHNVSPDCKIVVLALLPRGEKPNRLRDKHYQVNVQLQQVMRTIPHGYLLNADPGFVRSDNTIKAEDMFDYLHLTRKAYERFGTVIYEFVRKLL